MTFLVCCFSHGKEQHHPVYVISSHFRSRQEARPPSLNIKWDRATAMAQNGIQLCSPYQLEALLESVSELGRQKAAIW